MHYLFLLMLFGYLAGNIYLFVRVVEALVALPLWVRVGVSLLFWVAFAALPLMLALRNVQLPMAVMRCVSIVGSVWLIFSLYTVVLLLAMEAVKCFVPAFGCPVAAAVAVTIVALIYGYCNYRTNDVVEIDVVTDKPLGEPLRIVAVSDIHLGYNLGRKRFAEYVERIAALDGDVVLVCGDLIDNSTRPIIEEDMLAELSRLKPRYGIYAVPGNHEYISGIEQCEQLFGQSAVQLLRDSVATLPCGVRIIGRDDRTNRHRQRLSTLVEGLDSVLTIVLDHQPFDIAESESCGVDIHLSGHTHNGQVFPLNLLVAAIYDQPCGYRKWSSTHAFVSSGLALWGPPFRIGTRSDMALITLRSSQQ